MEDTRVAPIVGRAAELTALDAALTAGSGAIEVIGEPGIGKTRLLAELCGRADDTGRLVLEGRASELETDLPFGLFVDALDDYLGTVPDGRLRGLGEARVAELAAIFPVLAGPVADRAAVVQSERYRSHEAVRALFEELARSQPLVLALDDVHWADAASIELISFLLRRPPRATVLVALARRPRPAPRRLEAALAAAARQGSFHTVELEPLDRTATDQLLEAGLDEPTRARLHEESGGNPFYLEELARTAHREAVAAASPLPSAGAAIPPAVAGALASELEALSEEARRFARAAAVAGEPFDPELVAAIAGLDAATGLARLDELAAARLVHTADSPRYFRFRHPIVRRAVYDSAPPAWVIGAHGRAAAALAARGGAPALRAHHLELSATPGDEEAILVLTEAGHASAARAPATAARWFDAALGLLPAGDARRPQLLVPLATALAAVGSLEESRRALVELLELVPEEMAPIRGRVVAGAAHVEHLLGNYGAARDLLMDALERLPDDGGPEGVALMMSVSSEDFYAGDFAGQRHWAAEALARAEAGDDRVLRAAALARMAGAEYMVDALPAARDRLADASAAAGALFDHEIATRIETLLWLALCSAYVEEFESGIGHARRGIDVARSTGQGQLIVPLLMAESTSLLWLGNLEEAAERADAAVEGAILSASGLYLNWAHTAFCWVATLRGDIPAAVRAGEQAVAAARGARDVVQAVAPLFLASAQLEAGDAASCRKLILGDDASGELTAVERGFKAHWYEVLARAEIALGDIEAAEHWAERAESAADGLEIAGRSAEAHRAHAAVFLAREEAGDAVERARAAAAAFDSVGARIESARARILEGSALARTGARADAVSVLERAQTELAACGAARYRDQASRELRGLGRRVARRGARGAAAEGVESLSGREREIADLVSEGKTNKQIAAELFVSEKTVESHMAKVFAKLGVSSRAAVAGRLASHVG